MSHLSRIKTPDLPFPSVAAALQAYSYVLSSLDVRTPWEPLLPFLAYPKTRVYYVPARPCQSIAICFVFHILTIPYVLSLVDHCHIPLHLPPLSSRRRKGDSSVPTAPRAIALGLGGGVYLFDSFARPSM